MNFRLAAHDIRYERMSSSSNEVSVSRPCRVTKDQQTRQGNSEAMKLIGNQANFCTAVGGYPGPHNWQGLGYHPTCQPRPSWFNGYEQPGYGTQGSGWPMALGPQWLGCGQPGLGPDSSGSSISVSMQL